jgi:hypothetical protein
MERDVCVFVAAGEGSKKLGGVYFGCDFHEICLELKIVSNNKN